MATVPSDCDEKTEVRGDVEWRVRGFHDGQAHGDTYGEQPAGTLKLAAHFWREVPDHFRAVYYEAFLRGHLSGLAHRRRRELELLGDAADDDEPPTVRLPSARPAARVA